ncbi:MAG: ATP-dependent DNA helicase UvrD2 [Acidimicrobiales bacterium]|jgi:DNA helicase-2/ATP-dependent DNA helicase PcrA
MPDPIALGRSVVVGVGQAAPGEWSSCNRIRVSAVNRGIADELGAAWRKRRSVTIELTPGLGLDDPEVPSGEAITDRQPWEWSADLDLVSERLHHGVWANSIDARAGSSHRRWHWAELACSLGATRTDAGGDVMLPGGTFAVCDGGPLDVALSDRIGVPVLHRISLEHGMLQPLGVNDPVGVQLAPDQLEAVAEPGATARVIAPAGSGKTRVLTERARLLLQGWGLPPAAVALVAFNTRAANEMKTRLADVAGVQVRTLNALGLRLCGRRSTIEEVEVRRLLGNLVRFPKCSETDPLAPWLKALGRVRLGLADPEMVEDELPDVSDLERVARVYRAQLAEQEVVDFDEQVTGAIERLLGDPAFRLRAQRSARVLLIDEFQDLTPAHLLLIRLLSGPAGEVFAVGDDDQTIYGYAGATPRWLVDFGHWFPGATLHSLEVNYRCPGPVVAAASNLLTRNAVRVAKVIRAGPAQDAQASDHECLSILAGDDGPATRSVHRVRELLDEGAIPTDVAVLARVNASLAPVQVLLRNDGVPVNGGVSGQFLQRGGVRAALAWLTVATAPDWALPGAVLRDVARRPRRGMSRSLLDLVGKQRSVDGLASLAGWLEGKGSAREAGKVRDLADDLKQVRKAAENGTTAEVLTVLRSQIGEGGLDASATALDQWSHGAIAAHGDDLDALGELADLESDASRFPAWLSEQLNAPHDVDGVTLASIHAVKGREWPHVVVHHATSGLMPHRLAEDVEEERRVFHVALTRCRSSASIIPGSPPSPFLLELARPGRPVAPAGTPDVTATRVREASSRPASLTRQAAAKAEMLAAAVGSRFTHRGHDYEIVALSTDGVRALLGGGPAITTVAFGTPVTVEGRPAVLAHPRFAEAWESLRTWRAERAKAAGKPAFVVFDDKTLRLVAAILPTNEAGLLAISGIGPAKLESYGDELIAIAEQCRTS